MHTNGLARASWLLAWSPSPLAELESRERQEPAQPGRHGIDPEGGHSRDRRQAADQPEHDGRAQQEDWHILREKPGLVPAKLTVGWEPNERRREELSR